MTDTTKREAISPAGSGARGTIAGLAGAAAVAVLMSHGVAPELAAIGGAAAVGVLAGLGNEARNAAASGRSGFLGFLARIFSFLG